MNKIYTQVSDDEDNRSVSIDGEDHTLYQSKDGGHFYFSDRDREPVAILQEPRNIEAWRIRAYRDKNDGETLDIHRHRVLGWLTKVSPATQNAECTPVCPSLEYRGYQECMVIVDVEKGSAWFWPPDDCWGPTSELIQVCQAVLEANARGTSIIIADADIPTFNLNIPGEIDASDSFPFESRTSAKASA
jgi:hypothetical protein